MGPSDPGDVQVPECCGAVVNAAPWELWEVSVAVGPLTSLLKCRERKN